MEVYTIMSQISQGDRQALKALYDAYSPALMGVILRITKKDTVAEEVLQDVFVKIWKNASRYDPEIATPFTWMHTIARRSALHAIEKKDYKQQRKIQSAEESVSIYTMTSAEISKDTLDIPIILNQLPADQRRVIELAYLEGYTQSEIADHLAIPLGTVKSRIRIALQALRSFYNDQTLPFILMFIFMS